MYNYIKEIAKINKLDRFNSIIDILKKNNIDYQIQKIPDSSALGNIIVSINPSKEKKIAITAHYDNAPGTPGANDNAAACSILLNLIINNKDTKNYIEYVFFDLEENGGVGSNYYVSINKNKILYAINLDMCGIGNNIVFSHYRINDYDINIIKEIVTKYKAIEVNRLPYGDAYSFISKGIETYYIINSTNSDLKWFKKYAEGIMPSFAPEFSKTMHLSNDTIDNININQVELIYNCVNELLCKYKNENY